MRTYLKIGLIITIVINYIVAKNLDEDEFEDIYEEGEDPILFLAILVLLTTFVVFWPIVLLRIINQVYENR